MPLILIVEDDFLIGNQVRCAFEDAGHEVVGPAVSAEEAWTLLDGRTPDAAILDVRIKGPVNGLELAEQLIASGLEALVFLSGSGERSTREHADRLGAAFHMKPFDERLLLASVQQAVASRRGSQQA